MADSNETNGATYGAEIAGHRYGDAYETLRDIDPALATCFQDYVVGTVLQRTDLPLAEIEACVIASLVAQNNLEQSAFHFGVALNAGLSANGIIGTIIHCIPFCGWPKGVSALTAFKRWIIDNNLEFTRTDPDSIYGSSAPDYAQIGRAQGGEIYEDYSALESAVNDMAPGLETLVTSGIFGRFYGRQDISLRMRQLTAVAILTTLQRLPQLESHIKGAFRVGCSPNEVREVIKLMHLYAGWPAVLNALQVAKKISDKIER